MYICRGHLLFELYSDTRRHVHIHVKRQYNAFIQVAIELQK